ncbi:MAG: hypothetical protein Q8R01_01965, partial [Ramlibacter sp.]|nr:hypothetical protein [Ramlibacter sp.]
PAEKQSAEIPASAAATRTASGPGRVKPNKVLTTQDESCHGLVRSPAIPCLRAERPATMSKSPPPQKIGRDARSGEFIPVREAERRPSTTTVETIRRPAPTPSKPGKK